MLELELESGLIKYDSKVKTKKLYNKSNNFSFVVHLRSKELAVYVSKMFVAVHQSNRILRFHYLKANI